MSQLIESPEYIHHILESLRAIETDYMANSTVARLVGKQTMTIIAGPTAAGKTTLTQEAVRLDPELAEIDTTTTRPHRSGDPVGYRTGVSYTEIYEAVLRGDVANVNVVGTNIYATYPSGFRAKHNIGPVLSRAIPGMLTLGFDDVHVIYPLVKEDEYEMRLLNERIEFIDFQSRVIEGDESIEFARLNATANWLHFVESSSEEGSLTKAAKKVIDIVNHNTGQFMSTDHAVTLLDGMQKALHRVARDVH